MANQVILVTGASGNLGSLVLQQLLRAGASVKSMYRSEQEGSKAPQGANSVIADFGDPASLDRALAGVDKVYLVCSPVPQLVELEGNMIEACRRHGIAHLVKSSAFGAGVYDKSFPRWHFEVEQRVHGSGIPSTILRPESFMQNVPNFYAGSIKSDHAFYAAGGTAPIAFIDLRDVAAVAARVLTSEGHAGKTYTLTGPEALTYAEVAAKLSKSLVTEVRYVAVSQQQLKESMRQLGMPPWQVEALADLQAYYTDGPGAHVTHDVQEVLGREPIHFDQFLNDYAVSFAA